MFNDGKLPTTGLDTILRTVYHADIERPKPAIIAKAQRIRLESGGDAMTSGTCEFVNAPVKWPVKWLEKHESHMIFFYHG